MFDLAVLSTVDISPVLGTQLFEGWTVIAAAERRVWRGVALVSLLALGCAVLATPASAEIELQAGPIEQVAWYARPVAQSSLVFGHGISAPNLGHTNLAVGNGRIWRLEDYFGVRSFEIETDEYGPHSWVGEGDEHEYRGLAVYRNEVFAGRAEVGKVQVLSAQTAGRLRTLDVPTEIAVTDDSTAPTTIASQLKITGLDVAWQEVWVSMKGAAGQRAIVVLDSVTGATKAVMVQSPSFSCGAHGALEFVSGLATMSCVNPAAQENISVACRYGGAPIVNAHPWGFDAQACSGAVVDGVAPVVEVFDGDDIATVPELDAVVTSCRMIKRDALVTTVAVANLDPIGHLFADPTCADTHHQGIDAVWGMKWLLSMSGDEIDPSIEQLADLHLTERALEPVAGGPAFGGLERTTRPHDQRADYGDVAYNPREDRLDWWGDLAEDDWQRGTRCLRYIVSEADVFMTAYDLEHWYEPSRGFQRLEVRIDGTLRATLTSPSGDWCLDTSTIPSGQHDLELRAIINAGTRELAKHNTELRIDNTAPTGQVDPLPRFVRDSVTVSGTLGDVHAGPRDRALVRSAPGTSAWTSMCGTQTPQNDGPAFACAWNTTAGPDGQYRLRAHQRDLVSEPLGGPNENDTAEVLTTVDNTPPDIALSGLNELAGAGPVPDGKHGLNVHASDGSGSGVAGVSMFVDGAAVSEQNPGCPVGGCALDQVFTFVNDDFAEGPHTVRVTAKDELGHVSSQQFVLDSRNAPVLSLDGALRDRADGEAIWSDETAPLTIHAVDTGTGMKSVEVTVDGVRSDFSERTCPSGSCRIDMAYTFQAANLTAGSHEVAVIGTDQVGHNSRVAWSVRVMTEAAAMVPDETAGSSSEPWPVVDGEPTEDAPDEATLGGPDEGDNCQSVDTETDVCSVPATSTSSAASAPSSGIAVALADPPSVPSVALSSSTAAATTPAWTGSYGISHNNGPQLRDSRFAALGVTKARITVPWDIMLRAKGASPCGRKNVGFIQRLDYWLESVSTTGNSKRGPYKYEPLVSFEVSGSRTCKPGHTRYVQAMKAFRAAYPRINHFTPWNEPNTKRQPYTNDGEGAGKLWRWFTTEVCAPSDCRVAAGDFIDGPLTAAYLADYKHGAYPSGHNSPRFWAIHLYQTAGLHRRLKLDQFLAATRVKSGKQPYVWLTEQGGILRSPSLEIATIRNSYANHCADPIVLSPSPNNDGSPHLRSEACAEADLRYLFNNVLSGSYTGRDRITRFYLYQLAGDYGWDSGLWDHVPPNKTRGMYTIYKNQIS